MATSQAGAPPAIEPTSSPTQAAAPAPYGPAIWIAIPKIGVSTNVSPVGTQGGLYVVPSWEVGHHDDSANPGNPGNAVMNGHLETINAGHIFAHLKDLAVGDAVYTYTTSQRLTWAVRDTRAAPNTDRQFIGPTEDRRLTLYTCTGTFNPVTRDYSQRLVVVAELAGVDDRKP
ncbi:MAG: class F sortase [Chloroflexota bacterium]